MIKRLPIVFMVMGGVLIFVGIVNPFHQNWVLCAAVTCLGLAQLFMAIYANRLAKLEEKISRFIYDFDGDDLPMTKCNKCGRKYDMDVEECPYCELKKHKKFYIDRME